MSLEDDTRSATVLVPLLLEIVPSIASVIDVGCGVGAWLHEFQLNGVEKVLGLDGADIPPRLLQIRLSEYQRVDLHLPLPPVGRFDLALSLNVADGLPGNAAPQFISGLASTSDLVVFCAAVPGQATRPTRNERWPSYWSGLFAANGFAVFDVIRGHLWYDQRVDWCHTQNTLVFARRSREDLVRRLADVEKRAPRPTDIVHPRAFEHFRGESRDSGAADVMLFPFRLVEGGYQGYNILQIASGRFLGLAQREGAYVPAKLAAGHYESACVGASVDDVKAKISQRLSPEAALGAVKADPPATGFRVRLIEEGYRGYDILQIDEQTFLALAHNEGAYSVEKLAAGAYERAYVGGSAERVKAQCRRATR